MVMNGCTRILNVMFSSMTFHLGIVLKNKGPWTRWHVTTVTHRCCLSVFSISPRGWGGGGGGFILDFVSSFLRPISNPFQSCNPNKMSIRYRPAWKERPWAAKGGGGALESEQVGERAQRPPPPHPPTPNPRSERLKGIHGQLYLSAGARASADVERGTEDAGRGTKQHRSSTGTAHL